MSTATQNSLRHPVTSSLGNIFWRTVALLSPNNQDHTFMGDYIIPVLNQQTRLLLHLGRPYLTHTFDNALTVTLHISLKHLAAKIPYQLHNYFLPSFLPSFLRDLQHKRKPLSTLPLKTIIKPFRYLVSLSFIFLKT